MPAPATQPPGQAMHYIHEIQYIYWAYPITWGLSSVIYLCYYLFSDWLHGFDKKEHVPYSLANVVVLVCVASGV